MAAPRMSCACHAMTALARPLCIVRDPALLNWLPPGRAALALALAVTASCPTRLMFHLIGCPQGELRVAWMKWAMTAMEPEAMERHNREVQSSLGVALGRGFGGGSWQKQPPAVEHAQPWAQCSSDTH